MLLQIRLDFRPNLKGKTSASEFPTIHCVPINQRQEDRKKLSASWVTQWVETKTELKETEEHKHKSK